MRMQHVIYIAALLCAVAFFIYTASRPKQCADLYERASRLYEKLGFRVQAANATSPNLILQGLYLGDRNDAYNNEKLSACGITHILDLTYAPERPYDNRDVPVIYKHIPCKDLPFFDIKQHFDEAYEFIDNARDVKGNILVHCAAGVSRSGIIVAMYVARKLNMSAEEALEFVKKRRPKVQPNIGFIEQLLEVAN